jgi:hypothetical protein
VLARCYLDLWQQDSDIAELGKASAPDLIRTGMEYAGLDDGETPKSNWTGLNKDQSRLLGNSRRDFVVTRR